jgi:hypothetical protein
MGSCLVLSDILILSMHHDLPCCNCMNVRANHEQPHDKDEYAHDAANPLDSFALQRIAYINHRNGESSVWEDHRPPAVVSFRAPSVSFECNSRTHQVSVNRIFFTPWRTLIKAMQNHQNPIIQMNIPVNKAIALRAVAAPGCNAI